MSAGLDPDLNAAVVDLSAELIPMGSTSPSSAARKASSAEVDELLESLSRTMRAEEMAKAAAKAEAAANAPPPSPFDFEWHPVKGCRLRASAACNDCPSATSEMPVASETQLMDPIRLRKAMDILVAPQSDLFQAEIDDNLRTRIFTVMKNAGHHRFFVLTKNPGYMRRYFQRAQLPTLPNVWLGVSVEDQASFDTRVYELMRTPAANRWVAFEPLLGRINTKTVQLPTFDLYHPWRGIVQAYEYMDEKGQRHWAPDDAAPLQELPIPRWIYVAGQKGAKAVPPHPSWVKQILGEAEGISAWFGGFGEYTQTEKADLERDATLLYMNSTGELRGRGAGSKTNFLAREFDGETSAIFTRTGTPRSRLLLDGASLLQRAPNAVALRSGIRATPFNLTGINPPRA
ncbi:MAG TPA: DUF5131 family protein [Nevskiaceae bacterium]|nr:DUF5131 family protein [Nevskiaceae bacterium]